MKSPSASSKPKPAALLNSMDVDTRSPRYTPMLTSSTESLQLGVKRRRKNHSGVREYMNTAIQDKRAESGYREVESPSANTASPSHGLPTGDAVKKTCIRPSEPSVVHTSAKGKGKAAVVHSNGRTVCTPEAGTSADRRLDANSVRYGKAVSDNVNGQNIDCAEKNEVAPASNISPETPYHPFVTTQPSDNFRTQTTHAFFFMDIARRLGNAEKLIHENQRTQDELRHAQDELRRTLDKLQRTQDELCRSQESIWHSDSQRRDEEDNQRWLDIVVDLSQIDQHQTERHAMIIALINFQQQASLCLSDRQMQRLSVLEAELGIEYNNANVNYPVEIPEQLKMENMQYLDAPTLPTTEIVMRMLRDEVAYPEGSVPSKRFDPLYHDRKKRLQQRLQGRKGPIEPNHTDNGEGTSG